METERLHPLLEKLNATADPATLLDSEIVEMKVRWPGLWNRKSREWSGAQKASAELELMALNAQFRAWKDEAIARAEA